MINAFSTGLLFPLQIQSTHTHTHTRELIYAHCMSSSCHSSQDFLCVPTLQQPQITPHHGLRNSQFTFHWVHKMGPDPRTNSYTLWGGCKPWVLLRGWARENGKNLFCFQFFRFCSSYRVSVYACVKKNKTQTGLFVFWTSDWACHHHQNMQTRFHHVVRCIKCDINKYSSSSTMEF